MSREPRPCEVSIHQPHGGAVTVHVEARTLLEAAGLAVVEFRRQGIPNPGNLQVTVSQPVTYVVEPGKFWSWLRRESAARQPQEQEIRDKLRDLLKVPLSREEKRERRER